MSEQAWKAAVRERFGVEPTGDAMSEEIARRGWSENILSAPVSPTTTVWISYTLKVPSHPDIVIESTGVASLDEATGRALLRVPPDTWTLDELESK